MKKARSPAGRAPLLLTCLGFAYALIVLAFEAPRWFARREERKVREADPGAALALPEAENLA